VTRKLPFIVCQCGSQAYAYEVSSLSVAVKVISPTNSSSVRKSTATSSLLARWKLCAAERSWTTKS